MRTPALVAGAVISLSLVAMGWGALSAAAVPTDEPTPSATGSSRVGFTVVATASPTPTVPPGGGGGGGSGGGSGGDGGTPPACVPSTKTPSLAAYAVDNPSPLHLTPSRVSQGQDVLVQGDGFKPGEKVVIALYSKPVKLGTFTVRTNGQVYAEVTIPKRTELGGHTIRAIGFRDCHVGASKVSVVSPRGSGTSMFPWVVWILAGVAVGVAGIGILIAFLLGWLPSDAATAGAGSVATRVAP